MALTKIDDRGLTTPIDLLDSEKIRFGTGTDLEVFHDGTDSIIKNNTGVLKTQSSHFYVRNVAGDETNIECHPNGAVNLYYDNVKKFETGSYGVAITGDLRFADDSSCDIILEGGKIYGETAATGALRIQSTSGNANHAAIVIGENYGSDNGGITFYGAGSSTADVKMRIRGTTDNIEIPDSHKLNFGDGNDLQIYHDGSNSYIEDGGTGVLVIASNQINLENAAKTEYLAKLVEDGAVELYYDNSKKVETVAGGLLVQGYVSLQGGSNALIYIEDNGKLNLGSSHDLQIYHDGTDNHIFSDNGIIKIRNASRTQFFNEDGSTRWADISSGGIQLTDGFKFVAGSGDDLQLYFDGTHSRLVHTPATGDLVIQSDDIYLTNGAGGEVYFRGTQNGAVELYHDNNTRLTTTTTGIYVNASIAIGAEAANNTLNVSGSAGSGQTTLYYGFGTVDLTSASDERVKDNVVPTAKGLDEILKLPIVDFTYTPEYSDDSTTVRTGGIAQEWQKIDPNLVNDEDKDLLFINYKETIPLLIKAVQELSAEVEALKAK